MCEGKGGGVCPVSLDCMLPTFYLALSTKTTIYVSMGAVYFVFADNFLGFVPQKAGVQALKVHNLKLFFFILNSNICCEYLKEPSH